MLSYKEFEKMNTIGKTIAQAIGVVVGFIILYFAVEFLGFGNWVRKNSIWVITFALVMGTIFITNLAEWVIETMRHAADSDKDDLLEKLKDLKFDIDYIKNGVKVLKTDRE
jgi:NhaP-type Na+/H+ or K+/H+ antiporter